jgi:hypothetical protein
MRMWSLLILLCFHCIYEQIVKLPQFHGLLVQANHFPNLSLWNDMVKQHGWYHSFIKSITSHITNRYVGSFCCFGRIYCSSDRWVKYGFFDTMNSWPEILLWLSVCFRTGSIVYLARNDRNLRPGIFLIY